MAAVYECTVFPVLQDLGTGAKWMSRNVCHFIFELRHQLFLVCFHLYDELKVCCLLSTRVIHILPCNAVRQC